jgi:hypothetical protein
MKTDIKMTLEDGTDKVFSFKATGTTAVRFKTIFGDEIMAEITALWNSVGTDDLNTAAAITEGKKVDDETGRYSVSWRTSQHPATWTRSENWLM